jgi:hypothetical protein
MQNTNYFKKLFKKKARARNIDMEHGNKITYLDFFNIEKEI